MAGMLGRTEQDIGQEDSRPRARVLTALLKFCIGHADVYVYFPLCKASNRLITNILNNYSNFWQITNYSSFNVAHTV